MGQRKSLDVKRLDTLDIVSIILAALMVVFTIVECASPLPAVTDEKPEVFAEVNDIPAPPSQVTFFAAGDILAHDLLAAQGKTGPGSYNYDFIFSNMKDEIASYDISVITQETPFVDDDSEVSGYPTFGTPYQMGDAIVDAGFDVVVGATNHSFDKGLYGLNTTLGFWEKEHPEITLLGLHSEKSDADSVSFVNKNGIKIAMTEFTYGLNGFVLPEGKEYMVDLQNELDAICKSVSDAEDEADITIAFAHMGEEYSTVPSDEQREVAVRLVDAGADVVIMSHVHVVQPMEDLVTEKGNKAIVYYGIGNFVSNQMDLQNMLGGAAILTIEKEIDDDGTSETKVISHSFEPLICHWDSSTSEMYFLDDYTDDLAAGHAIGSFTTDQVYDMWKSYTNAK